MIRKEVWNPTQKLPRFTRLFKYKQFSIDDSNSAMKVGTDGTMLGCWVDLSGASHILDIGCGSGVICAISAQKNVHALIDGIDIEQGAITDAKANVSRLPETWMERITIHQTRLQDYQSLSKIDVIISNPPFFEDSQVSPDDARNFARHTNSLHYSEIFMFAEKNLATDGRVNLVLPYENGIQSIKEAHKYGLFVSRKCSVKPIPSKPPHRLLLEFKNQETQLEESSLTIETGVKRHDYTEEYITLGKDFYLYF